jgi:hypothetical protein
LEPPSEVFQIPDAAARAAEVERQRVVADTRHGGNAAAAERSDVAELDAVEEVGERLRFFACGRRGWRGRRGGRGGDGGKSGQRDQESASVQGASLVFRRRYQFTVFSFQFWTED